MATSDRNQNSKLTENELQSIQKKTNGEIRSLYNPIINDITEVENWDEVNKQVKEVFQDNDYRNGVKAAVLGGSVAGTDTAFKSVAKYPNGSGLLLEPKSIDDLTDYYLQIPYEGSKLSTRLRLNANEAERVVSNVVKKNLEFGTNWKALSKEIGKKTNTVGDVAKIIEDVASQGDKYIRGVLTNAEVKEFKKLVSKAKGYVEKLSPENAPTTQLKNAYNKVILSVESKQLKVLEKSLELAFKRKIDYNNERISRSELARAYDLSFHRGIEEDDIIIGYRFLLSPAHPVADQCDLCAGVNNGSGPGIYRKGDRPRVPVHPHCLCMLEPYVDTGKGTPKSYTDTAAKNYLNDIDENKRKKIIGAGNAQYKSKWQEGLEKKGVAKESWPKRTMLPKNLVRESK